MKTFRRVLIVTVGLAASGAVVGAVAGSLALMLGLLASDGPRAALDLSGYPVAAIIGAELGAVAAPVFGWLILRSVPLDRAIAWTAAGTALGGALGWITRGNPIVSAVVGSLIASVTVRLYSSRHLNTSSASVHNAV